MLLYQIYVYNFNKSTKYKTILALSLCDKKDIELKKMIVILVEDSKISYLLKYILHYSCFNKDGNSSMLNVKLEDFIGQCIWRVFILEYKMVFFIGHLNWEYLLLSERFRLFNQRLGVIIGQWRLEKFFLAKKWLSILIRGFKGAFR